MCLPHTCSLLDVMAESKAMAAAGITLPEIARHILTQEERVKKFRQNLQQMLDDLHCTLTSLDLPQRTLLRPRIDSLTR